MHSHHSSRPGIESLLGDHAAQEAPDAELLGAFMADLCHDAETTPVPAPGPELASILVEGLELHPITHGRVARPRRGRHMFETMKGSRFARVGVAGLAVSGILGAMGAANALPGPAQGAMEGVAHLVGFDRARPATPAHPETEAHAPGAGGTPAGAHTPAAPGSQATSAEHASEPAHPESGTETHTGGANRGPGGASSATAGSDHQTEHATETAEHPTAEPEHGTAPAETEHATEPAHPETETHGGTTTNRGSDGTGGHS